MKKIGGCWIEFQDSHFGLDQHKCDRQLGSESEDRRFFFSVFQMIK